MRNDPKTGIGDPEDRTVLSAQLGRTPSQELSSHSGAFQCELHRYDAGAKLGAGGMAAVFRAIDKITGAEVALKIIDNTDDDMARRARFEREVRAAGRLVHPNVCRVLSFGKAPAKLFMTMELVEGVTLQRVIKSRGSLPVPIALEALRQLLGALGCAHDHGVVHRDLKPANVMITPEGVLKLLDFGIAKSQEDATVTATGLLIGTPAFMSPEQIMGGTVDGRSDLFAAGVTLLVMLTGRTRFSGLEPAAVMVKVSSEPVGSLIEECPAASAPVDRFLAKLCAQKQENRFQTAQEALQALEQLAEVGDEESGRALLASYVQTPDEVASAIAQASAEIELRRADELLRAGPPAQPAAALCLYRASLLQPSEEIRGRLAALCARANITFEPVHDTAISEAMAAFEKTPAAAGVLKRLADLYRARGQVILAAAFLQRYLRVKPTDSVAQQQLNVLLDGPERTQLGGRPASKDSSRTGERLRTRDIVAGIKTGGHVDPAQAVRPGMAVEKAPAPPTKHLEREPRPAPPTRLVPADEPRQPEPREPEPRPALAMHKPAPPPQSAVQRAQAAHAAHAAQPTGAAQVPQTQSGGPVTGQPRSAALSLLPHQPVQHAGSAGPASGTQRSGVQLGTSPTGTGAPPSVILAPTDDAAPRVRMHPLVTLFAVLLIAGVVVAFFGRFMTTTVDTAQQVMSDNEQSLGRFERNNEERQRINLLNRAKADFERANFSSTIRNTNELLARDPPADLALTALWLRAQSRIKMSDTQSAINDLERIVSEAPLKDGRRNDAKKLLDELYAKPNELIAPRGF